MEDWAPNTAVKLSGFARLPSGLDCISLSAPLFRNSILGSACFDTVSFLGLKVRSGGC